jgi:hypothetical protein
MRNALRLVALALATASLACGGGSSGGGGTPPPGDPPPASCRPAFDSCAGPADCCGTCLSGYCFDSQLNGKCRTTDDCVSPNVCVSSVCAAASCRQDLDVCTADAQCCAGNCRTNGYCGANRPPVASVTGGTVHKRETVMLRGPSDPDFDALTYAWSLAGPPGSAATLSSATAAFPTFVTDVAGDYVVSVTVSDGQYSASGSGTVTAYNTPPVANAGFGQVVPRNTLVHVSGTRSTDVDKDPLTFAWSIEGPAGSTAAFADPVACDATFVPDQLGAYTLTLAVGDGTSTSTAQVVVTAVNTPPSPAVSGTSAVNAGEGATLSAATSTDVNGDPLTFSWSLAGPAGTAATLSDATGSTTSFVTDKPGSYVVTLAASDGIDIRTTTRTVVAHPHLWKLGHDVVAATYSKAIDRLVMISTTPQALWILDPVTEQETRIDLANGPPTSVGVSADGLAAAVGRNGGVAHVDLSAGTVLGECPMTWTDNTTGTPVTWNYDVGSVSVGPTLTLGTGKGTRTTRFAYTTPGTAPNHGDFTIGVDLDTCGKSSYWMNDTYAFEGTSALRPNASQLYVQDFHYAFYSFGVAATGPIGTPTISNAYNNCWNGFWFTEDGGRFVCQSGLVYGADLVTINGSLYYPTLGTLGNLPFPGYLPMRHADHSTVKQQISIIPEADSAQPDADTVLRRFGAPAGLPSSYPESGAAVALPSVAVDSVSFKGRGRWVFYRSDGSARYVVLAPPPASTAVNAVATMAP